MDTQRDKIEISLCIRNKVYFTHVKECSVMVHVFLKIVVLINLRQDKLINQMRQYCWTNIISECYTCHTCHTWSVRSLINSNTIIINQLRNC